MSTKSNNGQLQITIVKELRDYSKEPFVKKKREEAIRFLKEYGMPESFKKKK